MKHQVLLYDKEADRDKREWGKRREEKLSDLSGGWGSGLRENVAAPARP